jgi:hypothetical protein
MTIEGHAEFEPAESRIVTYPGDRRHMMTDEPKQLLGPDRRQIFWKPTHVEYDEDANTSRVVMRPVSMYELAQMPGVLEQASRFMDYLAEKGQL